MDLILWWLPKAPCQRWPGQGNPYPPPLSVARPRKSVRGLFGPEVLRPWGTWGQSIPQYLLISVLDMVEVVYESSGFPGLVIHMPESIWNRDLELFGVWQQRSLGSCYPNWKTLANVSHQRMCARFVHKAADLFLDFLPLLFGEASRSHFATNLQIRQW